MNGDTASTRGRRHTVTDPAMHTQRTRAPLETRTNRRGASKAGRPSSQPPSSVSGTWRRVGQDRVPREGARPAAGGVHRHGGTRASRLRLNDAASVSRLEGRGTNGGIVPRARSMRGPFCCLWPVRTQNTLSPGSSEKITRPSMTSYLRAQWTALLRHRRTRSPRRRRGGARNALRKTGWSL